MRPERAAEYLKLVKFFIFVARFKQKIKYSQHQQQ
jgi:hypothetical protein